MHIRQRYRLSRYLFHPFDNTCRLLLLSDIRSLDTPKNSTKRQVADVRYLEAGQAGSTVCYLTLVPDLELWQDGDDRLDDKSTDLAPRRLDVVAESLQSSKHAAYRPLRAVVLHARRGVHCSQTPTELKTAAKRTTIRREMTAQLINRR